MEYLELVQDSFTQEHFDKQFNVIPYVAYSVADDLVIYNLLEKKTYLQLRYKTADKALLKLNLVDEFSDVSFISNNYDSEIGIAEFEDRLPAYFWEELPNENIAAAGYTIPLQPSENKLTFIQYPEQYDSIGTFCGCKYLKEVILPKNLSLIDSVLLICDKGSEIQYFGTFYNCASLETITIPSTVEYIFERTFEGCYFTKDKFINNSSLDAEANNYWGATIVDSDTDGVLIKDGNVIGYRP